MTKHYFKRNRGHSLRSPHDVYFEKKNRTDREFNLSIRYGDDGEFEAIVEVQGRGILIDPIDQQRASIHIRNNCIEAYADNAGVDIILINIRNYPVPTVTFRFPSPETKTAFIDLIRPISSSDDESGNSTGSSSDSPSPPQDTHQD